MVKVKVMNRKTASQYSTEIHNESSVIISITDIESPCNIFFNKSENGIKNILRVAFNDVEKADKTAISESDAKNIASFVFKYKDIVDLIIVHCEAGMSRSAGCAAAIMKYVTGSDFEIFDNPYYKPNMTVYREVLSALFEYEDNITKTELKNTINTLATVLVNSAYKIEPEIVALFEKYSYLNPNKVEDANILINKIQRSASMYAYSNSKYPQNLEDSIRSKLLFLYQNYSYVKSQITALCDVGTGGTADITRNLVNIYIKSITDSNYKIVSTGSLPDFGDIHMWLNYIECIIRSYYHGPDEKYLETVNKLYKLKSQYLKK